jgi:hypothetical protein
MFTFILIIVLLAVQTTGTNRKYLKKGIKICQVLFG